MRFRAVNQRQVVGFRKLHKRVASVKCALPCCFLEIAVAVRVFAFNSREQEAARCHSEVHGVPRVMVAVAVCHCCHCCVAGCHVGELGCGAWCQCGSLGTSICVPNRFVFWAGLVMFFQFNES